MVSILPSLELRPALVATDGNATARKILSRRRPLTKHPKHPNFSGMKVVRVFSGEETGCAGACTPDATHPSLRSLSFTAAFLSCLHSTDFLRRKVTAN
eukprot:SAG31_NODE_555_length_14169_cov_19.798721_1_plen_98_part_00